jgi:Domain of unknown function (DUF4124)
VRKFLRCQFLRAIAGSHARSRLFWLAAAAALAQCELAQADTYKCVGVDGTVTYSDKACDARPERPVAQTAADSPIGLGAARNVPVLPGDSVAPVSSYERKIHELLLLTQFSAREYPGLAEVARYLVPRVDPNLSATPQDPRWTPLSRVIQADIRADMPQLGRAFADADQSLVRSLASQMRDADADALLSFFGSPTGVSYLQFLGDMRAAYASAVRSVLGHVAAQTPISQSGANAAVMQMRRRLVALAVGAASLYRAQDEAHRVHDPSPYAADGLTPEQIVAVTGPGLDAIAARYGTALPEFESFNASPPIRLFRSIVGRPVAAKAVATETAMNDFGEAELEKFGARWKVAYRRGIYYVAVAAGSGLAGSGTAPQIRHASYMSPRTGRAFDVTHVLQSACSRGSDGCKVACGNQLAGDPDFRRVKYCQIAFQCSGHPAQNVTLAEGRSVTLTCAQ